MQNPVVPCFACESPTPYRYKLFQGCKKELPLCLRCIRQVRIPPAVDHDQMRAMRYRGLSFLEIAREFGVRVNTVYHIAGRLGLATGYPARAWKLHLAGFKLREIAKIMKMRPMKVKALLEQTRGWLEDHPEVVARKGKPRPKSKIPRTPVLKALYFEIQAERERTGKVPERMLLDSSRFYDVLEATEQKQKAQMGVREFEWRGVLISRAD